MVTESRPVLEGGVPQPEGSSRSRATEESFVVLPPAATSMYKSDSASEGGGTKSSAPGGTQGDNLQSNTAGLHSSVTVLKRAFDIAPSQMQLGEEERRLESTIKEVEGHCLEVKAEMQELELKSKAFKELEKRFGSVILFWRTGHDKAVTWFLTRLESFLSLQIRKVRKTMFHRGNGSNFLAGLRTLKWRTTPTPKVSISRRIGPRPSNNTLCILKWVLNWFVGNTNFHPLSPSAAFLQCQGFDRWIFKHKTTTRHR